MPAIVSPVPTAMRVVAAAMRSGAVTKPIPGRAHRFVAATMPYGIAEVVNWQTGNHKEVLPEYIRP
ncbi:MAG TPA: hypothetical protein VJ777_07075, partial [Mycobacterium sp.]|nr:hypothetical protein [Mycobacterium sp.]